MKGKIVNTAPGLGSIRLVPCGQGTTVARRLKREDRLHLDEGSDDPQAARLVRRTGDGDLELQVQGDEKTIKEVREICRCCGSIPYLGLDRDMVVLRRLAIAAEA